MSGANGKGSYFVDRSLLPRVHRYLKENSHRRFIDVEEMADVLQKQYPDYGRKKKIPFRNSVKQGKVKRFGCVRVFNKSSLLIFQLTKKSEGPWMSLK